MSIKRILLGMSLAFSIFTAVGLASNATADGRSKDRGSISGYKFHDLNGNGRDDNEPRLEGVTILLNSVGNDSVSESTTTDENGEFRFNHLRRARYLVCEVAVPPLSPTTPECVEVNLRGKRPHARVVFGNEETGPGPNPTPTPTPTPTVTPTPGPTPTPTPGIGCTRTQGFWGSSPAGQALVPILVPGTMSLGSVAYTAAQLDDILDTPTTGNALLILAHQLITAKLNILAGASDSCISQTITDADTAIGSLVIPPVGSGNVPPSSTLGQTMTALATTLDNYNNGRLACAAHCP